ncbi:MAG TPA: BtpA/SgcQ family protein [Phycisphaerae bacterium]|nr:BtpA/SgcQ family protein [Phycisphaerae bacterium]HRY67021.1 BtpA/SgcQ family protein [Phycisphaerae bacterium]HSA28860.1 BtpA/SgcQ family protein [Phycisphaerae bacterium]
MNDNSQIIELFGVPKAMVAMIHVQALPGSPLARFPVSRIVEQAVAEARLLSDAGFDAIMIENMHDRPYLRQAVGPEIVAGMTAVLQAVRETVSLPIGVQVLAGANREALAVAMAGGATFIRAENFVFAHVADEGLMPEADAARLLRYRREISAEHIRIFADVKKKHSSHAMTADVDLAETARGAAFFGADGIIVTGTATAQAASPADVRGVSSVVGLPIAVGSGLTPDNLGGYWDDADVFIVGSFIKQDGQWHQPPDPDRVAAMIRAAQRMTSGRAG